MTRPCDAFRFLRIQLVAEPTTEADCIMGKSRLVVLTCLSLTVSTAAWPIIISHEADDSEHLRLASDYPDPIVLTRNHAGSADGMGTWIGEDWILTAAHVAEGFRTGDPIGDEGRLIVADVATHPGWAAEMIDLALIRVADGPSAIDIVPLCAPGDLTGATVVFMGAGDTGTGKTGPAAADGQMRMARNAVTVVSKKHLFFEFDASDAPSAVDLEGISGPGDSGGPAYVEQENGVCVVAVSSGQDTEPTGGAEGRYGVIEIYTRADVQQDWIESKRKDE